MGIVGLISSLVAVKMMESLKESDPAAALRNSTLIGAGIFMAAMLVYVLFFWIAYGTFTPWHWMAVVFGTVCGVSIGLLAEYYTASKPVHGIAEASKTGPATNIISGLSVGFMSCVGPLLVIALAIGLSNWCGGANDGLYCIGLAAVAMLFLIIFVS